MRGEQEANDQRDYGSETESERNDSEFRQKFKGKGASG